MWKGVSLSKSCLGQGAWDEIILNKDHQGEAKEIPDMRERKINTEANLADF